MINHNNATNARRIKDAMIANYGASHREVIIVRFPDMPHRPEMAFELDAPRDVIAAEVYQERVIGGLYGRATAHKETRLVTPPATGPQLVD